MQSAAAVVAWAVLAAAPMEMASMKRSGHRIEPPEILRLEVTCRAPWPLSAVALPQGQRAKQELRGPRLVRPDGTTGLHSYGSVSVAGLTCAQAEVVVERHLSSLGCWLDVAVDVMALYSVITESTDYGEKVQWFELLPHDTALDALGRIPDLLDRIPDLGSCKTKARIWVQRPCSDLPGEDRFLTLDWEAITLRGEGATNYELRPGDRVYVWDGKWHSGAWVAERLSPLERAETALADVGRFFLDALRHMVGQ